VPHDKVSHVPSFGTAAILAGGKSTRMGYDKQLMAAGGRRVVDAVVETLKGWFGDVLVVSYRPELYQGMGVRVVPDILPKNGLLGGIHTALCNASSRWVYAVACDMPELNGRYVQHMEEELERTGAAACVTRNGDWIEPLNAFYASALAPAVERHLAGGPKSVYSFVKEHDVHYVDELTARGFCPDLRMFLNLNTGEELARYAERLAGSGPPR
jgi:molybdopterin-guanine dinucleotide biosynthesis protein A